MRVTSGLLVDNFLSDLRRIQTAMLRLQHQSSTGRAFDRPVDNPSGSAVSLDLHSVITYLTQYSRNVDDGTARLQYTETSINEVDAQLQRVRELTVQASNSYLTRSDRSAIALEVNQLLEHVVTASNSNFRGRYIYSGFKTLTKSFDSNSNTEDGFTNSVTYRGDYGTIARNIGVERDLSVNFNGKDLFLEQTYELKGRQLAAGELGFNGAFELNEKLLVVTPTMTLADIRDAINADPSLEVHASIEPGFRLKLTSMNSTQAIKVQDISGTVLRDLGVLPLGAFNLAQAAPAGVPLTDSRGAIHLAAAFAPVTLTTGTRDLVVQLGGAANDNYTQTEVLQLDAKTYNTITELEAEIQKKADLAFGEHKLIVRDNGLGQIEIETYVQSSAVNVGDLRLGGTAPDGTVDTASALLGFNAVAGVQEVADTAGTDGNDRLKIDLGLSAYIVNNGEQPVDLPAVEINLDGDVSAAPPVTTDELVANINEKILADRFLSGLVEAVNDGGRIRLQTVKKDGSVLAADLVLANAVAGPVAPATDTLGALGFYRDPLTGISGPPVPAAVFGTAGFPPGIGAIVAGANDQFAIDLGPASSVDGMDPPAVTLTLAPGAYATAGALAAELNFEIGLSPVLKNAVQAVVRTMAGVDYVDIVTANQGSRVQAGDLQLLDVAPGTLANLGLGGPTVPGGGSSDGQGDIVEPANMIDTMIQIRDELLGYAAPKSRLAQLEDENGASLGLFPGCRIRVNSDGSSKEFVVQRFTTLQDLADRIEEKLGFQLEVEVLRDGRIQLYNPASSVVSDISIEAFDQKGNHIAPFEEAMSGLSGKLVYRGVLRSATVYENERFRRMTNRIGDVDDAFETVLSTLAQVGSRIKRLELTTSQNDSVQVNLQEMQTKNDYVDMAEVLTKLKEQENVLKAALSTGSRTLAPSLFDYLQ